MGNPRASTGHQRKNMKSRKGYFQEQERRNEDAGGAGYFSQHMTEYILRKLRQIRIPSSSNAVREFQKENPRIQKAAK